jgi:hypothetical protein
MNVAGSPFWTLWSAGWTMIWGGEVILPPDAPEPPAPPEPPEPEPGLPPFGEVVPPDPEDRPRPIVSRAAFVVARPRRFVNTTRYSLPLCDGLAANT